jgi:hypothetical protein
MYRGIWQDRQGIHDRIYNSRFQGHSYNNQSDINISQVDASVMFNRYEPPPIVTSNYDDCCYPYYSMSRFSARNRNEGAYFKIAPFNLLRNAHDLDS